MAEAKETKDTKDTKPAAEAAAPAATAPAKKNNTVLIIVIAVIIIFFVLPALAIFGLGYVAKKKIENIEKDGITIDGGDIKVNTNEDQKWPSSMPSDVPKFDGKIVSSTKFGDVITVILSDVTSSQVDEYKSKVAAAGWTIESETDLGAIKMYTAKKGTYLLNFNYSASDKGLNISLTSDTSNSTE